MNNFSNHQPVNGNIKKSDCTRLEPGTILSDRYQISEVLETGGTISIYKARDLHFPSIHKFVEITTFLFQDTISSKKEVLDQEIGYLTSLNHPSLPAILDFFCCQESSFLVREFINGISLETLLLEAKDFFDEAFVLKCAIDLCDLLEYLHQQKPEPIILAGIKPGDIRLTPEGKIFLVRFNHGKVFHSPEIKTLITTDEYSAPEFSTGVSSPQVDIFSLGATLYHFITRTPENKTSTFSNIQRNITYLNQSVTTDLGNIVMKALERNPEDRFPSAKLMKDALLEVQKIDRAPSKMGKFSNNPSDERQPSWMFKCGDEIRGSLQLHNDFLYFGSYDNYLYSLNSNDGRLNWKYQTEAGIMSTPAIHDKEIYIGSEDQRLHVVNIRSGKIDWSYYTGGRVCSSPRIAEGHVFFGSDDSHLHAVNLLSSRSVWQFEAASPIRSTPCIGNDMIYFGSESGIFYCLDFHGGIIWTYATKAGISSSPTLSDGIVYFTSRDTYVYALDARGGWVKWRFHMTKGSNSSPAVKDGILYVGSADGNIYALDARSGKEIWRFQTQQQVSSSPAINNEFLYCGSADGYLYSLDTHSGELRWKFLTKAAITGTPVVTNEALFIGSLDHCIYALPV